MNWFKSQKIVNQSLPEAASILHDEKTFYKQFTHDLMEARQEVLIESPFLTVKRVIMLKPVFENLISRNVEVFVMTRHPNEHDQGMKDQAEAGIRYFESLGVQILLCGGGHHRKLALIDREILWEGSLNILSQSHSREFMRRIVSKELSEELFKFLKFDQLNLFRKELNLL